MYKTAKLAFCESGESEQNGLANVDECIESGQFSKNDHFGEYSNSTNLPASGHCLVITQIFIYFLNPATEISNCEKVF